MISTFFIQPFDKILHLGACNDELYEYAKRGVSSIVLVEANPELIPSLSEICRRSRIQTKIYNKAVYNKSGEIVPFNLIYSEDMTNRGCSSLLSLSKHSEYYPHIKQYKTIECETITIDDILREDGDNFDVLNMDLQGAELLVLQGCSTFNFRHIYTEVSFEELYKNGCQFNELKEFLEKFGYKHVETFMQHSSWGDALFEKCNTNR